MLLQAGCDDVCAMMYVQRRGWLVALTVSRAAALIAAVCLVHT
jgi:hypothetical protein